MVRHARSSASLLLALAACSNQTAPAPQPVLRLGVLASLSGARSATSGRQTVEGALLAAEEVNAGGGLLIGGTRYVVQIVTRDVGDQADRATAAARELINQQGVFALVGPQFSRDAIPVGAIAEQARVPMISPMSSAPATTDGRRWVFRIAYRTEFQAVALTRFSRETLRARRAAVLYDVAAEYSRGLAEQFRREFEARGGKVVSFESYTTDESTDFSRQLSRIRATDPDVLLLPNFLPHLGIQLHQARALGIRAAILGTDSWDREVIKVPESEGTYVVNQWHRRMVADSAGVAFLARYQERFSAEAGSTSAATYDACRLIFHALQRAGRLDAAAMRDSLAATRRYPAVMGWITFDGSGDPARGAPIVRIRKGATEFVRLVEP